MPASGWALGDQQATLVAAGDIACDPDLSPTPGDCQDQATAALVTAANPDRVLALGDLQYSAGSLNDFQTGYELNWGAFKAITLPTPGNHEYLTSGAAGYRDYWQKSEGATTWYSERIGNWLILALDSNCSMIGGCGADSAQGQWLAAELAASDAPCELAFFHHPRFSSGQHGDAADMASLWQILEQGEVELALSGHDHEYERFAAMRSDGSIDPNGVVSYVVGTGGVNLRDFASVHEGSLNQIKRYGISVLQLHTDGWTEAFRSTDGATDEDPRELRCHNTTRTSASPAPPATPVTEPASPPAALQRQTLTRIRALAAGRPRALPNFTRESQSLRWKTTTPRICSVTRDETIREGLTAGWRLHASRRGRCRLQAQAAGSTTLKPLKRIVTVRIR